MKNKNCPHTTKVVRIDKDGSPSFYCADCGLHLKRMNVKEAAEYYEEEIRQLRMSIAEKPAETEEPVEAERMPCRYCTENYVMEVKYPNQRVVHTPIEAVYCPMCGRKLKPEDRAY